ncbi:hypothetical protein MNEG_15595 [Monoraphidium neglectum]|uniref:Uncharacterized protein n=1 Tax=Monoraphidium neglectum TaxID=145388 RepID=A0A0D2K8A1_9CHLO|nr:hypothetical protein MNEG_15595 [Monoraphidium neglectum]KIY92368.1 hypothetical protein MNEG_15595 [Monoraphidium neglectum]|eukprot:XP_013891388.1 hypothetical protein MNEG_15595 [Monoraphidium neglectum]
MRFNADLQTRPPWLPPAPCAAHLALLWWWEAGAAKARRARGWWRQVAAAEADLPQAQRLRAAQRDGALQRWLLPHLLSAALAAGHPPGAAVAGAGGKVASAASGGGGEAAAGDGLAVAAAAADSELRALVPRFAMALGIQAAAEGDGVEAALSAAFGGGDEGSIGPEGVPASRQLQLLDLALFHTAEAAAQLLACVAPQAAGDGGGGGGDGLEGASGRVQRRAALLTSALEGLRRGAEARLAPGACECGLLPGAALSLASLLVDGGCLWVTSCLESWSRAVKASKRKQSKKSAAPPPAAAALATPAVQSALSALGAAAAAAAALAGSLAAACKQLLQQAAEQSEAVLLQQLDPQSSDVMRQLVGWEPRLSVHHVIKAVQGEQRQVLQRVAAAAAALQQRLAAVAW